MSVSNKSASISSASFLIKRVREKDAIDRSHVDIMVNGSVSLCAISGYTWVVLFSLLVFATFYLRHMFPSYYAEGAERTEMRKYCSAGPYVWDRSTHQGGMGSVFQHRKRSIILADAVRAPWIGTLSNEHDEQSNQNNYYKWFGLGANDCNETMLLKYKKNSEMKFLDTSKWRHDRAYTYERLCSTAHPFEYRQKYGLDKNTVIEVNEVYWEEYWNYCTFNERFRARFHRVQIAQYSRQPRPAGEFWIVAHFRWGDVATSSVDAPNVRAGVGLSQLAKCSAKFVEANPGARVFLISKGNQDEFENFRVILPATEFQLNGSPLDALWTMAQSNVAIGGISTFFAIGAHLCDRCTVATISNHPKFTAFPVENHDHHEVISLPDCAL